MTPSKSWMTFIFKDKKELMKDCLSRHNDQGAFSNLECPLDPSVRLKGLRSVFSFRLDYSANWAAGTAILIDQPTPFQFHKLHQRSPNVEKNLSVLFSNFQLNGACWRTLTFSHQETIAAIPQDRVLGVNLRRSRILETVKTIFNSDFAPSRTFQGLVTLSSRLI